ncbi:hypothetical protein HGRIS_005388 [Hohenbuehelia grisea]|uniref:Uncharacterized protein n=1 Tax=Hohenbuehelia grisea TaxID=104357 RepID=A0ABR3JEU9_9AGAR
MSSPAIQGVEPTNPLKRKLVADDDNDDDDSSTNDQDNTDNILVKTSPSASPSPTTPAPSQHKSLPDPPRPNEYENGRVLCEVCSQDVSFRDDDTGGFTLKHWDAHRATCVAPGPTSARQAQEPVIYTPESTAQALAHPPAKRRRAKRTEEERIEYLRADPYVAQFEAFRVLCASCDKWIRLRPNSTYCSIPWDAHRKSCLSKKMNMKNAYGLEERNTLFSQDPDVRKYDAERVLCNLCDRWITLNPDDHLQAVQRWLTHRAACQRATSTTLAAPLHTPQRSPIEQRSAPCSRPSTTQSALSSSSSSRPAPAPLSIGPNVHLHPHHQQAHHPSLSGLPSPRGPTSSRPTTANTSSTVTAVNPPHGFPPGSNSAPGPSTASGTSSTLHSPSSPPAFASLSPTYISAQVLASQALASQGQGGAFSSAGAQHESRRRNAEQRAATLRADSLIGKVEPNRVFCRLCEKWVQLRQDSSYCAYPWVQHRGKCLARQQRRAQKAAELAAMRGCRPTVHAGAGMRTFSHGEEDELISDDADAELYDDADDPESEEGVEGPSPTYENHFRRPSSSHDNARHAESDRRLAEEARRMKDSRQIKRMRTTPAGALAHAHGPAYSSYAHSAQQHYARYPAGAGNGRVVSRHPHHPQARAHSPHSVPPRQPVKVERDEAPDADADADPEADAEGERDADADADAEGEDGDAEGDVVMIDAPADADGDAGRFRYTKDASMYPPKEERYAKEDRYAKEERYTKEERSLFTRDVLYTKDMMAYPRDLYARNIYPKDLGARQRRPAVVPYKRADLETPSGRKTFIMSSIEHLFSTSYDSATDELPVSALLAYVNAAMPPDKHEEYDTAEVTRAVAALAEKGRVVFEGDLLRLAD